MIAASLYIVVCSAKNAVRARLRRLREPRYFIGAIVGVAYLYFSFFRRFGARSGRGTFRRRGNQPPPEAQLAAIAAIGPPLTGLAAMGAAALAWVVPFSTSVLDFSKAETDFLFPAPVSRRSLIAHRLLRSQLGILFGSVVVGLASPSLSGYLRLRVSLGVWLAMCAVRVYFTGVTLTRARLQARERRSGRIAWLPITIFAACFAVVGLQLWFAWNAGPIVDGADMLRRLAQPATSGVARFILAPFVAIGWPMFAVWPHPYLEALAASAAVCTALVAWVLRSDGALQDVVEMRDRRAAAEPAMAGSASRGRAAGWKLATAGRPEAIFVWKAATRSIRAADLRGFIRIAPIVVPFAIIATVIGRETGAAAVVGMFALGAAAITIVLGPQILRQDIRDDLQHLELLKTWPVDGAAIVRGEMVWPGLVLIATAWCSITIGVLLSGRVFDGFGVADRVAAGGAAMLLAPALIFAQLLIHNASAIVFPAWVALGSQRSRGLDAMGQRIITLGGTLLVLVLMIVPAAVPAAVVWFILRPFAGPFAILPAAAAAAVAMAIEVILAAEALGPVFERMDVTAIERPE